MRHRQSCGTGDGATHNRGNDSEVLAIVLVIVLNGARRLWVRSCVVNCWCIVCPALPDACRGPGIHPLTLTNESSAPSEIRAGGSASGNWNVFS